MQIMLHKAWSGSTHRLSFNLYILQKWDSRACGVLWVQILASSQTKRSDGLSKSQTRRKVWRKYLKKRTSKQHYRMEGTTRRGHRLTRVARGIRQWEGVWLGQWSRVIGGVRSDTATGMLCRFHLRPKTSVDALSGNTALYNEGTSHRVNLEFD